MQLYNIEFFSLDLNYVGSQQVSNVVLEFDYLSLDENSVELSLQTNCNRNNIIYIKSLTTDKRYVGIVTAINETKKSKRVKFKSLLSLLDVPIEYKNDWTYIEDWIDERIAEVYIYNEDVFQNIPKLQIITKSQTEGSITAEENIINLYNTLVSILKQYRIAISTDIDFSKGFIVIEIKQNNNEQLVIEADLPNILEKRLEIKSTSNENTINKITVINQDDPEQRITYYRENDGNITSVPDMSKRIIPVIFSIEEISAKPEEFNEKALEKATDTLAVDDFNNLIELTVIEDDSLINPAQMEIAQKVLIITNNEKYVTYLTGYKLEAGKIKLIFGAIRLELTKKLKRRLGK